MKLNKLAAGQSAIIEKVGGEGPLRQHFLDMGVIPGVQVSVVKFAPLGDPVELRIQGYNLTLRLSEAEKIDIVPVEASAVTESPDEKERHPRSVHPSLGESGIHHLKGSGDPLPDDHRLTFALVGNQNCGKTTLFNKLTGSSQHVGNFPGVTVDRKDGAIVGHPNTCVTDLPGIYSMSPYTAEEIVSRNFVLNEKPDAIINIVDVTNIERNLYLTMQLLEMGRPMVVALNMMDELIGNGGSVDINAMEEMLGVPVVAISAAKNHGVGELIDHAIHIAHYREKPVYHDLCSNDDKDGAIHRCIHSVIHLIEDHCQRASLPVRFAAGKAIEGDSIILEQLNLDTNERQTLNHITLQMENERGIDKNAAMASVRFAYIHKLCRHCINKPAETKEHIRSERIDRILTGKYTAIPVFIGIMALVFILTFNVIGAFLQSLMQTGIDSLASLTANAMASANVNPAVQSLVLDGIFQGVGSILSFLPVVVVMFFFLSLLEDSGYIARVAFFMDKLLRKIGLSGRSIVPMLIGFGCTVPAVMATRTLPSERDRRMTILLTPFMSCTAKLPVYAFFVNAFFPKYAGLIMTGLYVLGIAIGILIAFLYKKTLFRGEAVPFVMELPTYRLPSLRNTAQLLWEKAKDFLQRAFTIILIASIFVWFLKSFDPMFNLVTDSSQSIMARISGFIAPVFAPIGIGDWRIVTALICGIMAKENVVSTMQILFASAGGVTAALSPAAAGAVLIFSLLYTPCIAAIASIKRELGLRWAVIVVIWQCVLAWFAAFIFSLIARALI